MVSNGTYTRTKRRMKKHKRGKARKRALRSQGSTPAFSLDPGLPASRQAGGSSK